MKENEEESTVDQHMKHQLAKYECSEVAWKWRKAFMNSLNLIHVDISNNGLASVDI